MIILKGFGFWLARLIGRCPTAVPIRFSFYYDRLSLENEPAQRDALARR
jgi:hypothetical protein